MPVKKNQGPSEADVIFNRANVALARSQALIQSWLPPKTAEEIANTKSEEELLKEDEELFKASPELLGVGAIAPENEQDALVRRRGPSNQRLLEQLLGKKAAKGHIASSKAPDRNGKTQQVAQSTGSTSSRPADGDSDDEEEGRASLVASKRKRPAGKAEKAPIKANSPAVVESPGDEKKGGDQKSTPAAADSSDEEDARPSKRRGGSYLDQILAEKANKKKEKQKAGKQG